jgi:hypothetical protein
LPEEPRQHFKFYLQTRWISVCLYNLSLYNLII